jgi:hypothetical protein
MRAYASDQRQFLAFCMRHGLASLPAEPSTVVLALNRDDVQNRDRATLRGRDRAALYADAGLTSPTAHSLVKRSLAWRRTA